MPRQALLHKLLHEGIWIELLDGVPATIGAMMFFKGLWRRPGVYNVEEFDPDPFMEQLMKQGLPWHEQFDLDLEL